MISRFNALFNKGAENATYRQPAGIMRVNQPTTVGQITIGKRNNPTTKTPSRAVNWVKA